MSEREILELETGTHPALQEAQAGRFAAERREGAKARLAEARKAWDLSSDLPYSAQAVAGRELLCAKAVAQEWGVWS